MRGPYRKRNVQKLPQCTNFKPSGIPRKMLKKMEMTLDEFEAIRLADYQKLEHLEASEKMNISRPTFTRLIDRARQKVAFALIDGMELIIEGGNVDLQNTLYKCKDCGDTHEVPVNILNENCPDCGSENLDDLSVNYINKENN